MARIFIVDTPDGKICLNVDNDNDANRLINKGAIELTPTQIEAYGMTGYEKLISPLNTKIQDGKVFFTPPSPTTLEEAKASKLKEINSACDKAVDALLEDYPDAEKSSFEQQHREAVKYQETGNPANAPLLSLLADARGISLDALCIKVIAKRNAYTLLCGNALAQKQQLKEKLERLKTVSAVESLDTTITIGDMK